MYYTVTDCEFDDKIIKLPGGVAYPYRTPLGVAMAERPGYIYILQSLDQKHWYIGSTTDLKKRIKKHNSSGTKWTRKFKPWKLAHSQKFGSLSEARKKELHFKSPKGYLEYRSIKESINGGVA